MIVIGVPASNFGPYTVFPDAGFLAFPHSLQTYAPKMCEITPPQLYAASFPIAQSV